ncbi:MAG: ATP-binding protein [Gammaproteobacteria bacterium]|nr:ATP-binding protein [Gammaproteobacteria bacterium]
MSFLNDNQLHLGGKHEEEVLYEQVNHLYLSLNKAIIAALVNAGILMFVLWGVIEHIILIGWFLSLTVLNVIRSVTAYRYHAATPGIEQTYTWRNRFIIGSLLSSVIWGCAPVFLFPEDDVTRQVFLAFIVGGLAAGAITSLSYLRITIFSYLVISLVPLSLRFFMVGSELDVLMGAMLALYFVMVMFSANETYMNTRQNILLRYDAIDRENHLQQSEGRYKTLLETATDAFYLHDKNGKFIDVNKQACLSLGYSRDELLKMSVADIEVDFDNESGFPALNKNEIIRINGTHRRKDGSTFPVEISLGVVQVNNEKLYSVLVRDVTERNRIDKMKSEFISTVSHELRTPLTSINGSLGLLVGGVAGELPAKANELVNVAINNTKRLLLLINDILDIQKIESGNVDFKYTKVSVNDFLKESIEDNSAYGEQYHIEFIIKESLPDNYIYADKNRLMQVMANILSNAAKFSQPKNKVDISVENYKDGLIRICVTDYGSGISEDFQDKIFEKFTQSDSSDTRKAGGTGLGLSISKLIMEKHHGNISFVSEANVGTTFYIDVPEYTHAMQSLVS